MKQVKTIVVAKNFHPDVRAIYWECFASHHLWNAGGLLLSRLAIGKSCRRVAANCMRYMCCCMSIAF